MSTISNYFNDINDPRTGNAARHKFCDIMTISLLCALCGGETAVDMADFAHAKEDFLREYLELPSGPPCHDTFSRIFRQLKPDAFQSFFDKFRSDFKAEEAPLACQPAIAFDGKEMRRSFDRAAERSNLNVVTAWAHEAQLSLGMIASAKGGGEISALRTLLKTLDITGAMITADALHCQRETCANIISEGGDYCLQLKGNQADMLADVSAFIKDQQTDFIDEFKSVDAGHGRIEERTYQVYNTIDYLDDTHKWPHLKAFVHVTSTRETGDKISQSERIYLLSKQPSAQEAAAYIRGHWGIENQLHWSLDVIMNDDQHRARKDNAPMNFAALRRIALNIIKANADKGSNRVKFKRAGWNDKFLKSLMSNF